MWLMLGGKKWITKWEIQICSQISIECHRSHLYKAQNEGRHSPASCLMIAQPLNIVSHPCCVYVANLRTQNRDKISICVRVLCYSSHTLCWAYWHSVKNPDLHISLSHHCPCLCNQLRHHLSLNYPPFLLVSFPDSYHFEPRGVTFSEDASCPWI